MSLLPHAHGGPPLTARLRATPEDFQVEELSDLVPDGEGDHAWLTVRKRGANTDWVAKQLADFCGIKPVDVGYAGLKDRNAVTTQTFTVHLPGRPDPDWSALGLDGVEVLAASRHRRKLKRGALAGNRFVLVLRETQGDREQIEQRLLAIGARGVPNYFGEQRFGSGGHNVQRAEAMFAGKRVDRPTRSLLLSAARSQLFNAALAERVRRDVWDRPLDGEVWSLAGSRSWFGPDVGDEDLSPRLASGDVHPSGPLWGRGPLPTRGEALALETAAVAPWPALCAGLEAAGMDQDRRPLRLLPRELQWQWLDEASLRLAFTLPPGSYATVVVRELLSDPG